MQVEHFESELSVQVSDPDTQSVIGLHVEHVSQAPVTVSQEPAIASAFAL